MCSNDVFTDGWCVYPERVSRCWWDCMERFDTDDQHLIECPSSRMFSCLPADFGRPSIWMDLTNSVIFQFDCIYQHKQALIWTFFDECQFRGSRDNESQTFIIYPQHFLMTNKYSSVALMMMFSSITTMRVSQTFSLRLKQTIENHTHRHRQKTDNIIEKQTIKNQIAISNWRHESLLEKLLMKVLIGDSTGRAYKHIKQNEIGHSLGFVILWVVYILCRPLDMKRA